jgi:hypothetical protein
MGLIRKLFGGGVLRPWGAVRDVAEVFTPSATKRMELSAGAQMAALAEMGAEFSSAGSTWFDSFINGLNRLPRPFLALGTVGLFVYAMVDPVSFSQRMVGLNAVPEPLWWLLGAVVAFYFGARETHYFRASKQVVQDHPRIGARGGAEPDDMGLDDTGLDLANNRALQDWQRQ